MNRNAPWVVILLAAGATAGVAVTRPPSDPDAEPPPLVAVSTDAPEQPTPAPTDAAAIPAAIIVGELPASVPGWAIPRASIDADAAYDRDTLVCLSTPALGVGYAWFISGPRGMEEWLPVAPPADDPAAEPPPPGSTIVFTAPPGTYTAMLVVVLDGGRIEQTHREVDIRGSILPPPPPPPPPPPVPGEIEVIILSESLTRTATQTATIDQIRRTLETRGTTWRILDPDTKAGGSSSPPAWAVPYLAAWRGAQSIDRSRPALLIGGRRDGAFSGVVATEQLPATSAAALAIVDRYSQ